MSMMKSKIEEFMICLPRKPICQIIFKFFDIYRQFIKQEKSHTKILLNFQITNNIKILIYILSMLTKLMNVFIRNTKTDPKYNFRSIRTFFINFKLFTLKRKIYIFVKMLSSVNVSLNMKQTNSMSFLTSWLYLIIIFV